MSLPLNGDQGRPALYHNADCPRCRLISRVLTWPTMGKVVRVPLSSLEARELDPERRRPFLFYRGRIVTGWKILPAIAGATFRKPDG
jgi:hypothetical protein